MSSTEYSKARKDNILLHTTQVENLFINELLPIAPGDYVKVFLFCLMYAENEQPIDPKVVANVLSLSEDEIDSAWAYWEDKGAVKRVYQRETDSYQIMFLSQIEELYGGKGSDVSDMAPAEDLDYEESGEMSADMAALHELELRSLYTAFEEASGRTITRRETEKIRDAIEVYHVTPDVFAYAIKYCAEIEKYSLDYIFKVALRWKEEGCQDISQVRERLDRESQRNLAYNSIFREMGFSRMPSPADRAMMSSWMDEMGYTLSEILEACRKTAGMRDPDLRYVARVLENRRREAGGIDTKANREAPSGNRAPVSKRVLGEYYAYLRAEAEEQQRRHIAEAKERIAGMSDILALEREFARAIVNFDFSPKAKDERKTQLAKRKELEEQKQRLLRENGYPEDYLDLQYRCEICRDTGVTDDGVFCSCTQARAQEAYIWNSKRTTNG